MDCFWWKLPIALVFKIVELTKRISPPPQKKIIENMSDTTTWLNNYVSGDELAKATEDFNTAFQTAASNFEHDEWYVDDCVNFIE